MKGILIFMPLAVISLLLYIFQSDVNHSNLELEKEKQRLERMVFDKEFDEFWDKKKVNHDDDIAKQKAKIEKLELKNEQINQNSESVHRILADEMKEEVKSSGLIDFEREVEKEK